MKRRIFAVLFVIYTIFLNSMCILIKKFKIWIRLNNFQRIFTAPVSSHSSSGYILYKKGEDLVANKSQYFLLDAQLYDENSEEQQLAFDAENDTYFLLYTSKNVNSPQEIELKNRQSLLDSNFNPRDPVRYKKS